MESVTEMTSSPHSSTLCCKMKKRSILVLMAVLGVVLSSTMKDCLKVSFDVIVKEKPTPRKEDPNACNETNRTTSMTIRNVTFYTWDEEILDKIIYSFYWGGLATSFIGGYFADTRSPKYVAVACIGSQSALSMIAPLVLRHCRGNWRYVMAWNIAAGAARAPLFSVFMAFFGQWVPEGKKTFKVSVLNASATISFFLSNVLGKIMIMRSGIWSINFLIYGVAGMLWCLLFCCLCYGAPDTHPTITKKERDFLRGKIGVYVAYKGKKVPWAAIFTSLPVWAVLIDHVGLGWAWHSMVTLFPEYLKTTLKIQLQPVVTIIMPLLLMFAMDLAAGLLCDLFIRKRVVEKTTLRKMFSNFGSTGAGIFAVTASYASCNQSMAFGLFTTSLVFMTFYCTEITVNILDIAPNFAGTLNGLAHTFVSAVRTFIPFIIEDLAPDHTLLQFRSVFWLSLAVFVLSNIIFAMTCDGEEQQWNVPPHLRRKNMYRMRER